MGLFSGGDDDDRYDDYLKDGSMFGKMDRQEWQSIQDRAKEIDSGLVLGTFERDERVWEEVKRLREQK